MEALLLFVHALSPLHVGIGQGVGLIDLPIAREKATGLPILPGSSLKGALRDLCVDPRRDKVFGPETTSAPEYAGSAQFCDQRLLLLPIRSLKGTFAWVTSTYLLHRFLRDALKTNLTGIPTNIPEPTSVNECFVTDQDCKIVKDNDQIFLEDLNLTAVRRGEITALATWIGQHVFPNAEEASWRQVLTGRFCLVHEDVLNFLLNTATEVTARIKLMEDAKTVDTKTGALWYEESLPTETIMAGLIVARQIKDQDGQVNVTKEEVFQVIEDTLVRDGRATPLQLGGKTTVGRGLCRAQIAREAT